MDPAVIALSAQLADTLLRNTASTIADKITSAKARKRDQETIAELEEIIGNLISDKNDLARIAQAFEQKLAGQRISNEDVKYITSNLIPILEQLSGPQDAGAEGSESQRTLESIKAVLSVETVNILQLVGFNFKRAIGEPLTHLVAHLISSKAAGGDDQIELQALTLRREIEFLTVAQDPNAYERLKSMSSGQ